MVGHVDDVRPAFLECGDLFVSAGRKPAEMDRKNNDKHQTCPEHRCRVREHGEHRDHAVLPAVQIARSDRTQNDAERDRNERTRSASAAASARGASESDAKRAPRDGTNSPDRTSPPDADTRGAGRGPADRARISGAIAPCTPAWQSPPHRPTHLPHRPEQDAAARSSAGRSSAASGWQAPAGARRRRVPLATTMSTSRARPDRTTSTARAGSPASLATACCAR